MRGRLTVADVRAASLDAGSPFFSRETMRFFGDAVRDFGLVRIAGTFDGEYLDDVPVLYRKVGRFACWVFREDAADLEPVADHGDLWYRVREHRRARVRV